MSSHDLPSEELTLSDFPGQANDNKIPNLNDLQPQLSRHEKLETIYLEGNPCQKAEGVNYRRKVMLALPQVKQIDATCGLSSSLH